MNKFTYYAARMLTDVDYSDSTPDVHYNYGEYGERLLMQEKNSGGAEIARTNYSYDSFKRLQTETRVFMEGDYPAAEWNRLFHCELPLLV